jgi:hypothetical protein
VHFSNLCLSKCQLICHIFLLLILTLLGCDHTEADQTSHTDRQTETAVTPVKTTQYKQSRLPVWCRIYASMDVYSITLFATIIWRRRKINRRLCWVQPVNEGRYEFGVFTNLYPNLLQDEKVTNYFRTGFESFRMLTSFASESVVKQNTNYRRTIGLEKRVAICIRSDTYTEICLLK